MVQEMDDDTRDMDGYDEQVLPDTVCSFLGTSTVDSTHGTCLTVYFQLFARAKLSQICQQDIGDVDGDYYNEDI